MKRLKMLLEDHALDQRIRAAQSAAEDHLRAVGGRAELAKDIMVRESDGLNFLLSVNALVVDYVKATEGVWMEHGFKLIRVNDKKYKIWEI